MCLINTKYSAHWVYITSEETREKEQFIGEQTEMTGERMQFPHQYYGATYIPAVEKVHLPPHTATAFKCLGSEYECISSCETPKLMSFQVNIFAFDLLAIIIFYKIK